MLKIHVIFVVQKRDGLTKNMLEKNFLGRVLFAEMGIFWPLAKRSHWGREKARLVNFVGAMKYNVAMVHENWSSALCPSIYIHVERKIAASKTV